MIWIDLTEPDPKHNGAAMRNERLAPIWKEEQDTEMISGIASERFVDGNGENRVRRNRIGRRCR